MIITQYNQYLKTVELPIKARTKIPELTSQQQPQKEDA